MCTVAQGRQLLGLQGCNYSRPPAGGERGRGCSQGLDGPQRGEGALGETLYLVVIQGEQREVLQVLEGVGSDAVDLVGIQKPADRDSREVRGWPGLTPHMSCTILALDTGDLKPLHTAFSFPVCMLTLSWLQRAQGQRGSFFPRSCGVPMRTQGRFVMASARSRFLAESS